MDSTVPSTSPRRWRRRIDRRQRARPWPVRSCWPTVRSRSATSLFGVQRRLPRRQYRWQQPAAGYPRSPNRPASIEVAPRQLRVGDGYAATLAITGYPPELGLAGRRAVLARPGRPGRTHRSDAGDHRRGRLRTQRARPESSRRLDADKGRLGDPSVEAAADAAADLADRVARGATRPRSGRPGGEGGPNAPPPVNCRARRPRWRVSTRCAGVVGPRCMRRSGYPGSEAVGPGLCAGRSRRRGPSRRSG
jgi:hypothetical protein